MLTLRSSTSMPLLLSVMALCLPVARSQAQGLDTDVALLGNASFFPVALRLQTAAGAGAGVALNATDRLSLLLDITGARATLRDGAAVTIRGTRHSAASIVQVGTRARYGHPLSRRTIVLASAGYGATFVRGIRRGPRSGGGMLLGLGVGRQLSADFAVQSEVLVDRLHANWVPQVQLALSTRLCLCPMGAFY